MAASSINDLRKEVNPGITAQVNVNGTWQKVKIVEKESEYLFKVHYIGQSDSADEWLSVSQIKNIDSSKEVFPAETASISLTANVNCSFNPPLGKINNSEKFSEKIAKRKIYEWLLLAAAKEKFKTGISYLYYQASQPYINEVTVSDKGLLLKNVLAPAGALVYPVKMKYRICKQMQGEISSTIIDGNFCCFRNKKGFWECPEENVQ